MRTIDDCRGRRGSVYVAVLGVALLVTVIGVSALLSVRIEQRAGRMTENAVKADFYAQSQLDLALFGVAGDASWRTTYTSGTWTPPLTVGEVTWRMKLVDEIDGNLADDANEPVRLYARAAVGDAVRIYSVKLQPRRYPNLLSNPDMEGGTYPWQGDGCTLESRTDDQYTGTRCILVTDRGAYWSGPTQSITSVIKNGATYRFVVWVKMYSTPRNIVLGIETTSSGSGTEWFYSGSTYVGATWTKVTSSITPAWSGTLSSADVLVWTTSNTTPFKIDDAVLCEEVAGPSVVPVPGTYRREVLSGGG